MTREMTDRELDLAIMRDMFGFSPCSGKDDGHDTDKCYWVDNDGSIWRHGGLVALTAPAREIEDAWLVVEEMRKRGWNVSMSYFSSTGDWFVSFSKPQAEIADIMCSGPSIERAICGAALAALESERAK